MKINKRKTLKTVLTLVGMAITLASTRIDELDLDDKIAEKTKEAVTKLK